MAVSASASTPESALIVGAGPGLSAALARLLSKNGMKVAIAARNTAKLSALSAETGAEVHPCDAGDIDSVAALFAATDKTIGTPDLVIYNPSARVRGGITELDPAATRDAINITCFGRFPGGPAGRRRMLERGSGSIFFTGALGRGKGLCPLLGLRHGQVRLARPSPSAGPRAASAKHPYRPFRDRWRHPGRAPPGTQQPRRRQHAGPGIRSPRPICSSTASTAAPGPGRSNCGHGWRRSRGRNPAFGTRYNTRIGTTMRGAVQCHKRACETDAKRAL